MEEEAKRLHPEKKYIYIVEYWVPFPRSEYGGLLMVIANDNAECIEILRNRRLDSRPGAEDTYHRERADAVQKAQRFALEDVTLESRIVEEMVT